MSEFSTFLQISHDHDLHRRHIGQDHLKKEMSEFFDIVKNVDTKWTAILKRKESAGIQNN